MMSELTYTKVGDYYVPDLTVQKTPKKAIGKYGRLRQRYLQEHRPIMYNTLLLQGKLYQHLRGVDETANTRMNVLMPQLMAAAGVIEELKATDQMKWVGLMNNCKAQAEEVILAELIYE